VAPKSSCDDGANGINNKQQVVACIGPVMVEAILKVVKDAFVDLCFLFTIEQNRNKRFTLGKN
jgi:hypothetical protein